MPSSKDIASGFGLLAGLGAGLGCLAAIALWGPWFACDGTTVSNCNALGDKAFWGLDASTASALAMTPVLGTALGLLGKLGEMVFGN